MKLDSHQHFWIYDAAQYPWIAPGSPLQRDWLPPDLAPLLAAAALDGCIAVQARQTIEESRWLLELAEHHSIIKGVVGWVDLRSPEVERELAALAPHPKFSGVRHVVQDEPDPRFILRPDFNAGVSALREFGLRYDVLIFERHLPAAIEFVDRHPNQTFILDHVAKPRIKDGILSPWDRNMRELAKRQNVYCKLSGMVTEADPQRWTPQVLQPYIDVVLAAFEPRRLMYGSDWPVMLLAGNDYARWYRTVTVAIEKLSKAEQARIMGGTAAEAYGI